MTVDEHEKKYIHIPKKLLGTAFLLFSAGMVFSNVLLNKKYFGQNSSFSLITISNISLYMYTIILAGIIAIIITKHYERQEEK